MDTECGQEILKMALQSGAMGLFAGSVVTAWKTDPQVRDQTGPMVRATFRTIKSYTTVLTTLGAAYAATRCLTRQKRERDDVWNEVAASVITGILVGIRRHSFMGACGAAAALSTVSLVAEYSGMGPTRRRDHSMPFDPHGVVNGV